MGWFRLRGQGPPAALGLARAAVAGGAGGRGRRRVVLGVALEAVGGGARSLRPGAFGAGTNDVMKASVGQWEGCTFHRAPRW